MKLHIHGFRVSRDSGIRIGGDVPNGHYNIRLMEDLAKVDAKCPWLLLPPGNSIQMGITSTVTAPGAARKWKEIGDRDRNGNRDRGSGSGSGGDGR